MDSAGTMMSLMGTGLKVGGTIGQGIAARNAGEFEAKQYEMQAGLDRAAAQRSGFERANQTARVLGQQRAIAAASGGGVNTPTISEIMGETAARGSYLQRSEQYKGDVAATNDINAAAAARARGKNAYTGSLLEGIATGLSGAAKFAPRSGLFPSTKSDSILNIDDNQTGWKTRTKRASDIPLLGLGFG